MADDEATEINVMLPLPLDVASTLTNLVSRAYPNGSVDMDGKGWLKMRVPAQDRIDRGVAGQVADEEIAEAVVSTEDPSMEGEVQGFQDGNMLLGTPEQVQLHLSEIMHKIITANPDAINYLEWTAIHPDGDGEGMVVSVSRSIEQTPHALRMEAEDTLAKIRKWADERRELAPGLIEELYDLLPGVQMTPDTKAQFQVT